MIPIETFAFITVAFVGMLYTWPAQWARVAASAGRPGGRGSFRLRRPLKIRGEEAVPARQSTAPAQFVYTDGACYPNQDPGPGGWAYVALIHGQEREESGEHPYTTKMRMQLTAAIEGLEAAEPGSAVILYTPSQIVQQAMTDWIHRWLRNDWRNSNGQAIDNRDLWEQLHALSTSRSVQWEWLRDDMDKSGSGEGQPHRVHALAYGALHRAAAGPIAEHGGDTGPEQEMQPGKADIGPEREMQPGKADKQLALAAESQALQRRWAELHEEVLHLDQEWQCLLDAVNSRLEAARNGQPLDWTDGAFMFVNLGKHATHLSDVADEALQTCDQYAQTLQRALNS